jgi:hypothetical protein
MQMSFFGLVRSWVGDHGVLVGGMMVLFVAVFVGVVLKIGRKGRD